MDENSVQFSGDDISASSGNKANATANVALPAVANKDNFVTGFDITGLGATAASAILVTLTGLKAGTLSWLLPIPVGAGVGVFPLQVRFPYPLQASGQNQAITLSVPAFGAGNTNACATLYGFIRG